MSPQNLTNVYNQNPTLQSNYTLQQYLDLFGGSSTPASTATATTTATTTTPTTATASQGIINQNINQYQNQGGGDGPQGGGKFGNLDMDTAKEFSIDGKTVTGYKNLGSGLYQDVDGLNIQNLGIGSFGVMGLIEKAFGLDKKDPKYAGLFDKVSYKALMKNPALYKSFFDRQDVAKQKKIQEAVDKANRIELAKLEQEKQAKDNLAGLKTANLGISSAGNTAQSDRTGGNVNTGGAAGNMGGGSRQATSAGSTSSGRKDGGWGWAKGGFVRGSYFNGGIVSLRRR